MNLQPVTSSNIAAIGYEPETRTLGVQFKSGAVYHYSDVPPKAHADLMAAKSHGGHFAAHIRDAFRAKKQL